MQQFRDIVNELKEIYNPYHKGLKKWESTTETDSQNIILPPWLCQPYVRASPDQSMKEDSAEDIKVGRHKVNFYIPNVSFSSTAADWKAVFLSGQRFDSGH